MPTERYQIRIDQKGAQATSREIAAIGKVSQATTSSLGAMQTALLSIGVGFGAGEIIQTIGGFEQGMARVRAVIREVNDDEFSRLVDTARELGGTTVFTAQEVAGGMEFLARAGLNLNEILALIPDTLKLAQAGVLDMASAADIASNIMASFEQGAQNATEVMDVLAATASSSNQDIFQLSQALKFAGATANSLDVDLEATAAAIGILSDRGIQATLAGTAVRRMLLGLASPTKDLQRALESLNLEFEDVSLKNNDLFTTLERLRPVIRNVEAAADIFGVRGGPAAAVIAENVDAVRALNDELEKAGGTLLDMSTIMTDTIQGDIKAVTSAFQEFIIQLGDAGLGQALRDFLQLGAGVLRYWNDTLDPMHENVETIKLVAEGIELLGSALEALILTKAVRWIAALGGALARLNPYVAAGSVAVVGLVHGYNQLVGSTESLVKANEESTASIDAQIAALDKATMSSEEYNKSLLDLQLFREQSRLNELNTQLAEQEAQMENVLSVIETTINRANEIFQTPAGSLGLNEVYTEAVEKLQEESAALRQNMVNTRRVIGVREEAITAIEEQIIALEALAGKEEVLIDLGDDHIDILAETITELERDLDISQRLFKAYGEGESAFAAMNDQLDAEETLLKAGVQATEENLNRLIPLIRQTREYEKALEDLIDVEDERQRKQEQRRFQAQSLTQQFGDPRELFMEQEKAFQEMVNDNLITQQVYERAVVDSYEQMLEASNDWASGAELAHRRVAEEAGNSALAAQDAWFSFYRGLEDIATDALTNLELSWESVGDVARTVLSDINRMIVRQNIVAPLAASLSNGNGAVGFDFLGGLFKTTTPPIPSFDNGGISTSPGIYHAGVPEAHIPLDKMGSLGGTTVINNITNIKAEDPASYLPYRDNIERNNGVQTARAIRRARV